MELPSWFWLALGGGVLFAFMSLAMTKSVSITTPAKALFVVFGVGAVLLAGYLVVTGQGLEIPSAALPFILLATLFSVVANVLAITSLQTSPNPGYTDAVTVMKTVFLVLLAVPLLGSSLSLQGLAGIALVIAGVALVALA